MSRKFKQGQMVVAPQFLINGTRMDTNGVVQRYISDKVEVQINSVYILFDEDRLHNYDEFWDKKNKEKK